MKTCFGGRWFLGSDGTWRATDGSGWVRSRGGRWEAFYVYPVHRSYCFVGTSRRRNAAMRAVELWERREAKGRGRLNRRPPPVRL